MDASPGDLRARHQDGPLPDLLPCRGDVSSSCGHVRRSPSAPDQRRPGNAGCVGAPRVRATARKREAGIRAKHPKLGGLILAVSDDPQCTTAWHGGALGEERLGQRLNGLSPETMRVLRDRRLPVTRANIGHIAVTPSGIYVIDAKRYVGKRPTLQVEGGFVRPRVEKLLLGGRDRTSLVDRVLKQVAVVHAIVGDTAPITGSCASSSPTGRSSEAPSPPAAWTSCGRRSSIRAAPPTALAPWTSLRSARVSRRRFRPLSGAARQRTAPPEIPLSDPSPAESR